MLKSSTVFAATLIGVAVLAQPVAAQDFTTATFGGTTIWAGGGVQFLSLPDINFTATRNAAGGIKRQTNSHKDWLDAGGSVGGGIETALGNWGGFRVSGSVEGFWSNVEDDHTTYCRSSPGAGHCAIFDPSNGLGAVGSYLRTRTDREADYWGGSAELKFATGAPTEVKPEIYRNDYFIAGFDVRGIDQENRLHGIQGPLDVFTYSETLDATYTGGYIGFGGEYSFGFIPVIGKSLKGTGGIYDRLGLRTFLNATAGFYNVSSDYNGRFGSAFVPGSPSRIGLSEDEFAFIGTVSLETRKQLSDRTSLSLWTDYEYISDVPQMKYAGPSGPTRIDYDDVFATRTMLRLNVGLGSQQLYAGQGY
jgi:hypothetical protein